MGSCFAAGPDNDGKHPDKSAEEKCKYRAETMNATGDMLFEGRASSHKPQPRGNGIMSKWDASLVSAYALQYDK